MYMYIYVAPNIVFSSLPAAGATKHITRGKKCSAVNINLCCNTYGARYTVSHTAPQLPLQALHYLVLISEVDEKEIFKICLEYWNSLAADLYRENPFSSSHSPMLLSQQNFPPRRQLYLTVLSKVSDTPLFFTIDLLLHTLYTNGKHLKLTTFAKKTF